MPLEKVLLLLTVDIAVIITASRLLGLVFRRFQQPQVIGEIVAGILLGPSLLGWLAPEAALTLFPPAVLPYLKVLSEYGVLLFMFLGTGPSRRETAHASHLGFMSFWSARCTLAGIEVMHAIRKGQLGTIG